MIDKNPYRFGPTRGELWFWLWLSVGGLGFLALAVFVRGLPSGLALVEVVGLALLVFGYLGGRSIKRLLRREHP
jgi:VIT1/CCC1 family predicted Fe2+/Mn2+ transporter